MVNQHLVFLFVRAVGYAALATALVYLVLVIRPDLPPTRSRLFTSVHLCMAGTLYCLAILSAINVSAYYDPRHSPSLFIMEFGITPLILTATGLAWWFSFRQTRKEVYIQHIGNLML